MKLLLFISGEECVIRVFFVYKLNPDPIEYDCWCFDICHESEDQKFKVEKERQKTALRRVWGKHYDARTSLYGVVLGFGVIGNVLTLITVWRYLRNSVTNIYIANLAVADLLVMSICVPFKVKRKLHSLVCRSLLYFKNCPGLCVL